MASRLLTFGAAYAIRIIVLKDGVMATGLYQAAWGLGGLYAGFFLQAMGTDFYPRLTATADDHVECNDQGMDHENRIAKNAHQAVGQIIIASHDQEITQGRHPDRAVRRQGRLLLQPKNDEVTRQS